MSGNYSRHSKTTRHLKEKESLRSKYRSKCHQMESKTPPLPIKTTSTLEELIRKRDTLKEELKKIVKCTESEGNKNTRKRRHSREDYITDVKIKKNGKEIGTRSSNGILKNKHESSPELDNMQIESEDEEKIIQQRRQQRKQLMEKFSVPDENVNDSKVKTNNIHIGDKISEKIENQKITKQVTDMFSEKDEFPSKNKAESVEEINCVTKSNSIDDWDDSECYYKVRAGDVINNKYTVKGLLGQGVFSNVVRAQEISDGNNYVAIKIVRNNDLMYRTSLKEVAILTEIKKADVENKYHCVQFFAHFMHKGHLCLVLESLHMDLRAVVKRYGKHHGINMKALVSYSRQLLLALRLLKKLGIVHADIKPDNILVNEKKNVLKLCDFGSACKVNDHEPTPYLVSRFYRAPEIILGVSYKHGVDIWAAACTMYEMATGRIMFTGSSNNKMLKCFMDIKGKFPSKFVKRGKFKDQHFNYNNNFLLHKKDAFSGREKLIELSNIIPCRDLHRELKKSYKNMSDKEDKKIAQLRDLIDKMTVLDSSQRISVSDCLKHPFIFEHIPNAK